MSIGKKLTLSLAIMVAISLTIASASLFSIGAAQERLEAVVNLTAKQMEFVDALDKAILHMRNGQRGLILYSALKQPERARAGRREFEDASRQVGELIRGSLPLLTSDEARQAAGQIESAVKSWQPLFEQIASRCDSGTLDAELDAIVDQTAALADPASRATSRLLELAAAQKDALAQAAEVTAGWARWIIIGLVMLCLGGGAAAMLVLRHVHTSLSRLADQMSGSAEQVREAAVEVAASSQAVSRGAADQAASLEETSASGEEITSMTRRNADSSSSAEVKIKEVEARIRTAQSEVEAMLLSMSEITDSSGKISKIIRVIDEIAFQTNILALNAAVEAARAGEAGLGFAVVADEVRNLAQRSAQAARDTATLIEESINRSQDGKSRLDRVADAMRAIAESGSAVTVLVEEVRTAGQEQAGAMEQISQTLAHMASITQETASGAEQSASASQAMAAQARALNDAVLQLRMLVGGGGRAVTKDEQVRMAIGAHEAWWDRLAKAIETGSSDVDVETARRQDACTFGKWLKCGSIGQSPAAKRVCELHQRFHIQAAAILEDALAGRKEKARQALSPNGEFAKISSSLKSALQAL